MENWLFKNIITFQVVGWSILWASYVTSGIMGGDHWLKAITLSSSFIFVQSFCVYGNYLILIPLFFEKKKYRIYGIGFLSLGVVAVILHTTAINLYNGKPLLDNLLFQYIYRAPYLSLFMGTTSFFRFGETWTRSLKAQEELKSSKLKTELNFLKAQIQPHFLFNTLNNIYSYAYVQHPKTTEMIEQLSSILRYIVYDSQKEKVSLNQEITVLKQLIQLYKVKNTAQQNILLDIDDVDLSVQISPLILISLVENAFKHGDALTNPDGFMHLSISITSQENLHFRLLNSFVDEAIENRKESIGNKNILRQLELSYKEKYVFSTSIIDKGVFEQLLILKYEQ